MKGRVIFLMANVYLRISPLALHTVKKTRRRAGKKTGLPCDTATKFVSYYGSNAMGTNEFTPRADHRFVVHDLDLPGKIDS